MGENDGTVSEPTSYSERNIDEEVELHRLQELLRTGNATDHVEETSKQTIMAGSHDSSINLSASSSTTTEAEDTVASGHSSITSDSAARRERLKERRTYFMQNGCNRQTDETGEQKRHSVDVSRLADRVTFQETASSTAATCTTSAPVMARVLPSTSRPGDIMLTVPSSRAVKMQHAVEQQLQLLADDLQRTFHATTALSAPSVASPYQQQTTAVQQPDMSAGDSATKCAADSQSVTSDYSTMSSICGGQDADCRRNRLASADLEILRASGVNTDKTADRSAVSHRRNRNEASHSTPRSQSSGNFSLTNSDPMEVSPYTASAMELSQDSIDSAADRSDQLSLSLSSQMSGSQISDCDDLLRTAGIVDKQSYSPLMQPSVPVDQNSSDTVSSCVTSANTQVDRFGEPTDAGLILQSVQHDFSATKTDSESSIVLDNPSCEVQPGSSEKEVQVGNSTAEVLHVDREFAGADRVTSSEQSRDCSDSTNISQLMPPADRGDKRISVNSNKEQLLQSQHPVHRLVRRHTLGGTGDLAIRVVDLKSESPLTVQSAPLQDEERLSAWQRLKPVVKDQLPNFGMWLATQRQLYHVRSSPALFVGVAVSPAPYLHGSQLNCQSVV